MSHILRLTLLAPDIVEAILDGRQPERLTLDLMRKPFAVEWKEQRDGFMRPLKSARRWWRPSAAIPHVGSAS